MVYFRGAGVLLPPSDLCLLLFKICYYMYVRICPLLSKILTLFMHWF